MQSKNTSWIIYTWLCCICGGAETFYVNGESSQIGIKARRKMRPLSLPFNSRCGVWMEYFMWLSALGAAARRETSGTLDWKKSPLQRSQSWQNNRVWQIFIFLALKISFCLNAMQYIGILYQVSSSALGTIELDNNLWKFSGFESSL